MLGSCCAVAAAAHPPLYLGRDVRRQRPRRSRRSRARRRGRRRPARGDGRRAHAATATTSSRRPTAAPRSTPWPRRRFDLVLLDVGLGAGPDGVEVCRRLRGAGEAAHVVAVTARDGEADVGARARGRRRRLRDQAGRASPSCAAACGRVLRRVQPQRRRRAPSLRHGALRARRRRARGRGRRHRGAPHLLGVRGPRCAAARGRRGCSRASELLDAIFGDHAFRDPRAIDVHVHYLREKLAAAGAEPAASSPCAARGTA